MRLLKDKGNGDLIPVDKYDGDFPRYAILSHTWGAEEVTFKDLMEGTGKKKAGYEKIEFCRKQAASDGLSYLWVDTCCIDKSSSAELSEAINSMFRWYQNAAKCYVYLSDVSTSGHATDSQSEPTPWSEKFRNSRWFCRGWTLQELIAPASVEFFSRQGDRLGSKISLELDIHEITGIAIEALSGVSLMSFTVQERLAWAEHRQTTRQEDKAYSLLGIFSVDMSLRYGEGGEKAFERLQRKIEKSLNPQSKLQQLSRTSAMNAYTSEGISLQSNFAGLVINSAARPDYRGQFSYSSLEPVKAFVPRPLLYDQIRTQLCDDVVGASTKTLVVWGLGGAGKSQLVLDYVRHHRTDYQAIFWIEAGRKESLDRDFVNLYHTLFGLQMVDGKETASVESSVNGVKSWFSGQQGPWLMVFDGADTIENKETSDYIDIKHLIPNVASLHVIVTSRSSTAKDMTRLDGVHVSEMEEAQAVELFNRYSQLGLNTQDGEIEEVKAIVKELGYLALAVTLAGTYLGQTPRLQSEIKAYLPEYRLRRRELLKRNPETLTHQYSASVLTTWETSYQAIVDYDPAASILMTMLSFLSFDDVFLQLFGIRSIVSTGSMDNAATASWKSFLFPGQVVDNFRVEECFKILQRYSFVQWKADQRSYAMHKLVHAWGYDRLPEDKQDQFCAATLTLLVEAIRDCGNAPEDKLRLVPHIMANFATVTGAEGVLDRTTDSIFDLLAGVGVFVIDIGRLQEGRMIEGFICVGKCHNLGEEHPDTISAMSNLATTFGHLGQLDEAAKMKKDVLEKRRRILGEEHPNTISAMNNLANTFGDLGQLDEAAKMKKDVLEKTRRILGEEHPNTISAMNNLANTFGDLGQLDEAAKMQKDVLEKRRRILGEEHPDTISAMSNLANTLGDLGQLDEAAKMQKDVLEKRRRILGEEHPDTISAMSNLANTLGDLGQLDEAAKMQKDVLEKRRRILGEEHPDTISAMSNLAATLGDLGQLDEAAKMQKDVLEKSRRILGEEHPNTILAMSNLAATLGDLGQLDEAAKMQKDVLAKRRRILGEEHPDTISAMSNLAATLGDLGQLDEAAKMQKDVLEKSRRILGEEHPNTISAMSNLAATLRDLGQLDEAAKMQKDVLEKRRRILGEEHPDTISAMSNLAATLGDLGQLDEAAKMQKDVLEKSRRILGEEHPNTISAMSNLAATLRDLGQLDEAAKMQKDVLEKRRRILGEEHPDTISAMNNLAVTLRDLGQLHEGVALMEEAEEKMKRIRGDQHPHTKVVARNLATIRARVTEQNAEASNSRQKKKVHSLYDRMKRRLQKRDRVEELG